MIPEDLESQLVRWFGLVMACTICLTSAVYVLLAGKVHGLTARVRRQAFRCVAATIMRPNMGLRVSLALVASGYAFVAFYRVEGQPTPDPIKFTVILGMFLSVVSTAGVAFGRFLLNPAAFAAQRE